MTAVLVRRDSLLTQTPGVFDTMLFLVWIGLLLAPLFQEISVFGLTLKREIKALRSEVRDQVTNLRSEVRIAPIFVNLPTDRFTSRPIVTSPREPSQKIDPFPTVLAQIQQRNFELPRVGFALSNLNKFPLKVRVIATVCLGTRKLGVVPPDPHGYYSGKKEWNVNAENAIFGNFSVHPECADSSETLRIELQLTMTDPQGRAYELLPVSYTYVRESKEWYLEPVSINNLTSEKQSGST